MKKTKKSGVKLWFSVDSGQDDPAEWSTLNVDIEDLDLTEEQAQRIGDELRELGSLTVHSWITRKEDEQ